MSVQRTKIADHAMHTIPTINAEYAASRELRGISAVAAMFCEDNLALSGAEASSQYPTGSPEVQVPNWLPKTEVTLMRCVRCATLGKVRQ